MERYEDKYIDASHIDLSGMMVDKHSLDMILMFCSYKDYIKEQTRSAELHFYCPVKVPTGEIRTLHLVF